jgi:hypothetical protein
MIDTYSANEQKLRLIHARCSLPCAVCEVLAEKEALREQVRGLLIQIEKLREQALTNKTKRDV